jgi:hypothetical protein
VTVEDVSSQDGLGSLSTSEHGESAESNDRLHDGQFVWWSMKERV